MAQRKKKRGKAGESGRQSASSAGGRVLFLWRGPEGCDRGPWPSAELLVVVLGSSLCCRCGFPLNWRLRHPYPVPVEWGVWTAATWLPRTQWSHRDEGLMDHGWIKITADSSACDRCQGLPACPVLALHTQIRWQSSKLMPCCFLLLAIATYCYGWHQPYPDGTISASIYGGGRALPYLPQRLTFSRIH